MSEDPAAKHLPKLINVPPGGQITPEVKYLLTLTGRGIGAIAGIVATGDRALGPLAMTRTEYWGMPSDFVAAVRQPVVGTVLEFMGVPVDPSRPDLVGFPGQGSLPLLKTATEASWHRVTAPAGLTGFFSHGTSAIGISFALTPPPTPRSHWTGNITWYQSVLLGTLPRSHVVGRGDVTLAYGAAPQQPTNVGWFAAVVAPIA
jgi:hypothetical protein